MNYKIRKEYECRNNPHENINALNHGIKITKSHSFGFLFNQNLALESFALVISSGFCLNRIHHVVCFIIVCGSMMTSSNGNIFRVTCPLCGEFTGPGEFPTQRPVTRSFDVSLICVCINGWVNNREAGGLRRHRGHYDIIVMLSMCHYIAYRMQNWHWTTREFKIWM